VETGTSTGNVRGGANLLFVAVTSPTGPVDNRVLAIDLGDSREEKSSKPFVYDYVKVGLNTTSEFEWPDNLALDPQGNLYIAEDPGGNFTSKKKGDDIWVARPGTGKHSPAASVERVGSLTDCDAEPTGIYWDLRANRLFVNVQHRGGDRLDKAVAITSARGSEEREIDR
jgi:secreted PhoX family phosphatase